jgi:hypothetical protein
LQSEVEKELKIPSERQRYWNWWSRNNGTYRPDLPLTPKEEEQRNEDSLSLIFIFFFFFFFFLNDELQTALSEHSKNSTDVKFYLEVAEKPINDKGDYFPPHERDDALLFVKYYDPVAANVQ